MKYPADRYVFVHDQEGYPVEALLDDEEDYQDMKDGYALRRLRKAAKEWGDVEMYALPHDRVLLQVVIAGGSIADGKGDTIAEAADKCREAL